ncbi:O-antigen polymerase [hydrothermal vent metagenome]|uniref:O-antigen polymerase n=1 Tax=hydrothermal vent metagenome TaxID=652676 RepID=A0A3B0TXH6_9ZZZZ
MLKSASIKLTLFYTVSILFILLNAYFIAKKDSLIINFLPVAFTIILLAVFSVEKLIYLAILFTPLSVPLRNLMPGLPFDMYLPTEPLLFGILLIFLLKVAAERGFDKKILTHPVSIVIFINLAWIFITSMTSTMPVVSFKFLLSRVWFVVGLYLLVIKILKKKDNYEQFIWMYVLPLLVVITYAISRHIGYGLWHKDAAHFVVNPFYNDHTSYGAILAMYIPFLLGMSFGGNRNKTLKLVSLLVLLILFVAVVLSYSRAAWVSMVAGLMVWGIIKLKIRFRTLFATVVTLLAFFFVFENQLVMYLERNSKESSANMMEHISSISNITTDASNLERINRWNCAIRMFRVKPLFGYGPGTYMFKYGPFQINNERTIISTNAGDGGNAHSEYLGPLAESGVLGMLTFLLLIAVVIYTGINTYTRTEDKRLKTIVLAALIGLITYYIHGLMNNFLDTDKASVPFWGFTAIIVAIDLKLKSHSAKDKKAGLN